MNGEGQKEKLPARAEDKRTGFASRIQKEVEAPANFPGRERGRKNPRRPQPAPIRTTLWDVVARKEKVVLSVHERTQSGGLGFKKAKANFAQWPHPRREERKKKKRERFRKGCGKYAGC